MFGAVMTPDNQVYAYFNGPSKAGPGLYRLIRDTGAWQAVQGMAGEPVATFGGLLGMEGESLVWQGRNWQLFWSKVSE